MIINHADLVTVFPYLEWKISESEPYGTDGASYKIAEANVLTDDESERGYITLIVYSSGEMHADFKAYYSDGVGCSSYPGTKPPTVIETLQSLRNQIEWQHRLYGSALGVLSSK